MGGVVSLRHDFNDFESLRIIKLRERSHSFAGFSNYITQYLIDKYSDKKNL